MPFERRELRSKEGGKKSIHFNGSRENIELLLRTVISANQLSIHGAVADLCNEVPKDLKGSRETCTTSSFGKDGNSYRPLYCRKIYQCTAMEKPCVRIRAKLRTIVTRPELSKLCSDAGLKLVEQGQHFYTLDTEDGQQTQHLCREYTMPRNEKETRIKGWILKNTRIGPVLNTKVCYHGRSRHY